MCFRISVDLSCQLFVVGHVSRYYLLKIETYSVSYIYGKIIFRTYLVIDNFFSVSTNF